MARSFLTASAQNLAKGSAVVASMPFTMAAWVKRTTDSYLSSILCLGADANNYWDLELNNDGRNRLRTRAGGSEASAFSASGSGLAVGVWGHFAGVVESATSRIVYVNGGSAGSNSTSLTPSTPTETLLGKTIGTTSRDANAEIAEVAFWNVALTAAEIASLAAGVSPWLVRRSALVSYSPLIGGYPAELDLAAGNAWTHVNSPAVAVHPRVFNLPRTRTIHVPASTPPGGYPVAAFNAHYSRLRNA